MLSSNLKVNCLVLRTALQNVVRNRHLFSKCQGTKISNFKQNRQKSTKKCISDEYKQELMEVKEILNKCFQPNYKHQSIYDDNPFLKCQPKKTTDYNQEECEVIIRQLFPEDATGNETSAVMNKDMTNEDIASEASRISELAMSPGGLSFPSYSRQGKDDGNKNMKDVTDHDGIFHRSHENSTVRAGREVNEKDTLTDYFYLSITNEHKDSGTSKEETRDDHEAVKIKNSPNDVINETEAGNKDMEPISKEPEPIMKQADPQKNLPDYNEMVQVSSALKTSPHFLDKTITSKSNCLWESLSKILQNSREELNYSPTVKTGICDTLLSSTCKPPPCEPVPPPLCPPRDPPPKPCSRTCPPQKSPCPPPTKLNPCAPPRRRHPPPPPKLPPSPCPPACPPSRQTPC